MSFRNTKFHEILWEVSDELPIQTPRKKINLNFLWICAYTQYVLHNYKVSWNSVEQFQKNCPSCIFDFNQISQIRKTPILWNCWIKIFCKYAHLQSMSCITPKYHEILQIDRGVAQKQRTDRLNDGRFKNIYTLYPPLLVAWGIVMSTCNIIILTCDLFMSTCEILMLTCNLS